jgi:CheY-like chemotaxis protein
MGVRCSLAHDRAECLKALEGAPCTHILASASLAGEVREMLLSLPYKPLPIFMKEHGEVVKDGRSITMPVYSISLANILNDTGEAVACKHERGSADIRFIAPSACILIVDDIATNLKVAEGLLAPYKMDITTCLSGAHAIQLIQKHQYDIIFMDHMMPEMDGVAATKAIRAIPGEYFRNVPIIALTANAVSGMREMFLEKGFSDYLSKPIEMRKLNEIMAKWVPSEKRESAEPEEEDRAPLSVRRRMIDGVDMERGIRITGGSEKAYRGVLALFCKDASERMHVLREAPDGDNLPLFITQVHALKSAAGSIGAASLSDAAARLEEAGRRADMEAIHNGIDGFREALAGLVELIQAFLGHGEAGGENTKTDRKSVV